MVNIIYTLIFSTDILTDFAILHPYCDECKLNRVCYRLISNSPSTIKSLISITLNIATQPALSFLRRLCTAQPLRAKHAPHVTLNHPITLSGRRTCRELVHVETVLYPVTNHSNVRRQHTLQCTLSDVQNIDRYNMELGTWNLDVHEKLLYVCIRDIHG